MYDESNTTRDRHSVWCVVPFDFYCIAMKAVSRCLILLISGYMWDMHDILVPRLMWLDVPVEKEMQTLSQDNELLNSASVSLCMCLKVSSQSDELFGVSKVTVTSGKYSTLHHLLFLKSQDKLFSQLFVETCFLLKVKYYWTEYKTGMKSDRNKKKFGCVTR